MKPIVKHSKNLWTLCVYLSIVFLSNCTIKDNSINGLKDSSSKESISVSPIPTPMADLSPTPTPTPTPTPVTNTTPTQTPTPEITPLPPPTKKAEIIHKLFIDNTDVSTTSYDGTLNLNNEGFDNTLGIRSVTQAQYNYSGILKFNKPLSISEIAPLDEFRVSMKIISNPVYIYLRFNDDYNTTIRYYLPKSTPLNKWFTYYYVIPESMRALMGNSIVSVIFNHDSPGEVELDNLVFVQTDGGSLTPKGIPNLLGNRPQVPSTSIFRKDLSTLPVLTANSVNWLNSLAGRIHPDFGNDMEAGKLTIGIPVNIDDTVRADKIKYSLHVNGGPFANTFLYDESDFVPTGYPWRSTYEIEYGSDKHLIVADPNNGDLYEQWQSFPVGPIPQDIIGDGVTPTPAIIAPFAMDGTFWNLNTNACRPPTYTSADAAGLPIYPLLLSYDDVANGDLQHMLRFTKNNVHGSIWPSSHVTSSTNHSFNGYHADAFDSMSMPFGTILRLKASFDVSGYDTINQRILRGLKKHGMILADNGGNGFISGMPDARWNSSFKNEKNQVEINDLNALKKIAIVPNFEVVDVSGIMVRSTSYESK